MRETPLKIWLISSNITDESAHYMKYFKQLEKTLHIPVEYRLITWNRAFETIVDAFKNNSAPDVFSLGTTWVHTLRYLGYLAPLPDSFHVEHPIADWITDCVQYEGTRFAVPFFAETYVLMARQKNLDAVGIKAEDMKDWDGFLSSCERISAYFKSRGVDGHIPFAFPIRPEIGTLHRFVVWLFTAGWSFPELSHKADRIFRNDISIKTLGFISKLLKSSGTDLQALKTSTFEIISQFHRSDNEFTFFIGNGSRYVYSMMNNRSDTGISIYPMPALAPDAKTFGGGSVLTVSSTCSHPELAWQVVDFLSKGEIFTELQALNGNLPFHKSSFWTEYGNYPYVDILEEQLKKSSSYPFHPSWHAIEQNVGEYLSQYLWDTLEGKNPETYAVTDQILENLDRGIINILDMMWEMHEDEG